MEKLKMTKDEFAVFMANVILKDVKMYQFDAFYDIAKIVRLLQEKRGNSKDAQIDELHLMTRDTGCDLVNIDSEIYETYKRNNRNIYKLRFCWNEDYMSNETFCTILNN